MYSLSLFIFTRDLRLFDNRALYQACQGSDAVVPCFIFNKEQVSESNPYRSRAAVQFMVESLQDLDQQIKKKTSKALVSLYGDVYQEIESILDINSGIEALYISHDYTPFAQNRLLRLEKICKKYDVDIHAVHNHLLTEPDQVLSSSNEPYKVFTPFYKAALKYSVLDSVQSDLSKLSSSIVVSSNTKVIKLSDELTSKGIILKESKRYAVQGGRAESKKILDGLNRFSLYEQDRDMPSKEMTTKLSAYNKFGTHSVREVYFAIKKKLKNSVPLIRQLYWRDFYTLLAYYYPHVFGHAFYQKYDELAWENDKKLFKKWCEGETGFPIVDAGMRQLFESGYMHNRVRMITASFLIKDLHIDWRIGERFFAQHLIDYDPAVNNGNWQWVASTGADQQPYFRIFNPWLQQKKFDPDCVYIKKWIPELKNFSSKEIHNMERLDSLGKYPAPCVDHAAAKEKTLLYFKKVS